MNNPTNLIFALGWVFLTASFFWPKSKWGGRVIKLVISSFSLGLFVANTVYTFLK